MNINTVQHQRARRGHGPVAAYQFVRQTMNAADKTVYDALIAGATDAESGPRLANSPMVIELYHLEKQTGLNKNQIRKSINHLGSLKFHTVVNGLVNEFSMINLLGCTRERVDSGELGWIISHPMQVNPAGMKVDESWAHNLPAGSRIDLNGADPEPDEKSVEEAFQEAADATGLTVDQIKAAIDTMDIDPEDSSKYIPGS